MSDPTPPAVSDAMREALVEATLRKAVIAGSTNGRTTEDIVSELSGPIVSEIARLKGGWGAAEIRCEKFKRRSRSAEASLSRLRADIAAERRLRGSAEPPVSVPAAREGW